MSVDTSALVAIVRDEAEAQRCLRRILDVSDRRISAANLLEAFLVIDGMRDRELSEDLDATVEDLQLVVVPVTRQQIVIGREAYRRFGKGSGHPARLNYGDCFAYALARFRDEPLLFIGNDFGHTDINAAT